MLTTEMRWWSAAKDARANTDAIDESVEVY
jgi:hypothetical protein